MISVNTAASKAAARVRRMRSAPKTTTSKPNLKAPDNSNTVGVKHDAPETSARCQVIEDHER